MLLGGHFLSWSADGDREFRSGRTSRAFAAAAGLFFLLFQVCPNSLKEFFIFHVPNGLGGGLLRPVGNVRHQLAEPPLGIAVTQVFEGAQDFFTQRSHCNLSPTRGKWLRSQWGRSSITSTRTVCP